MMTYGEWNYSWCTVHVDDDNEQPEQQEGREEIEKKHGTWDELRRLVDSSLLTGPYILEFQTQKERANSLQILTRKWYLTIIPLARMGSESIAHEAEGQEGERSCFSKIQLVGQKYREKTILASKCDSAAIGLVFKAAACRY